MSINRVAVIAILVLIIFTTNIHAQNPSVVQPNSVSSVTGSITSEGAVRMIAHGQVLQIRMEIYSAAGDLVSDSGLRQGNIVDWKQTDAAQPLVDGSYLVVKNRCALHPAGSKRQGAACAAYLAVSSVVSGDNYGPFFPFTQN